MKTIIYLIQVSACTGIFYCFYHLMLRRLTFFSINRWYLLSTMVLSFMIPLITIPAGSVPEIYTPDLSQHTFTVMPEAAIEPIANSPSLQVAAEPFNWMGILPPVYFFIAGLLTTYLLISLRIVLAGLKGKLIAELGNIKVLKGNSQLRNSSFLNYIFINDEGLTDTEMSQIIAHEMIHVQLMHSIDKIIARIVQIALWFNPFAYAYFNAIEANHEYEVDSRVSENSDKEVYVSLLLRLATSGESLAGHNFSKFPLSKRISMLFNKPTKNMKKVIYALIIPLVVVCGLIFANREIKNETPEKPSFKETREYGKNWEASPEGQKVLASGRKIWKHLQDSSNMEAVVTSLSLPPKASRYFSGLEGIIVRINGEEYIINFGSTRFKTDYQHLYNMLKVNDKIVLRSHSHTGGYTPSYPYFIIGAVYVERNGKVLYKRPMSREDPLKIWEASPEGKELRARGDKIMKFIKDSTNVDAVVTSPSLPSPATRDTMLNVKGVMVGIHGESYILTYGPDHVQHLNSLKVNDKIVLRGHTVLYSPNYLYPIIWGNYVERNSKILFKHTFE